MTLRITATVERKAFQEIVDAEYLDFERAVTTGIERTTDSLKRDLRGQTEAAGLGARLANTWRSEVFPDGEPSAKAAGLVYSKAPRIVEPFAAGAEIRPTHKKFLAIPTENAPDKAPGGHKLTPSNFPGRRDLIFREGRNGTGYLALSRGGRLIPMFILVPVARIKRRLDMDRAALTAINRLPGEIAKAAGGAS